MARRRQNRDRDELDMSGGPAPTAGASVSRGGFTQEQLERMVLKPLPWRLLGIVLALVLAAAALLALLGLRSKVEETSGKVAELYSQVETLQAALNATPTPAPTATPEPTRVPQIAIDIRLVQPALEEGFQSEVRLRLSKDGLGWPDERLEVELEGPASLDGLSKRGVFQTGPDGFVSIDVTPENSPGQSVTVKSWHSTATQQAEFIIVPAQDTDSDGVADREEASHGTALDVSNARTLSQTASLMIEPQQDIVDGSLAISELSAGSVVFALPTEGETVTVLLRGCVPCPETPPTAGSEFTLSAGSVVTDLWRAIGTELVIAQDNTLVSVISSSPECLYVQLRGQLPASVLQ